MTDLDYKYEEEVKKIVEEIENKKLNKIYNDINNLNEIGNDLNNLLISDNDNLKSINKNVYKTEDYVIQSNFHLTETLKYKNSKKKLATITTFTILGLASGGIAAPLIGINGVGAILGVTAGTGLLGGVLGKGVSKII
tara:strand:+ start:1319 stop:1732 length:414 start_codon:yes stop_codon:yes gene_type:complete